MLGLTQWCYIFHKVWFFSRYMRLVWLFILIYTTWSSLDLQRHSLSYPCSNLMQSPYNFNTPIAGKWHWSSHWVEKRSKFVTWVSEQNSWKLQSKATLTKTHCCTWKNMVRVSDGETGTTTGCCSEDDGSSLSSALSSSCWVSSSTAFTTRFLIVRAFRDELRVRKGKLQKTKEGEEDEEEGSVEEEGRMECREKDENSVAIFKHSLRKEKFLFLFRTLSISIYLSKPENNLVLQHIKKLIIV